MDRTWIKFDCGIVHSCFRLNRLYSFFSFIHNQKKKRKKKSVCKNCDERTNVECCRILAIRSGVV